MLPTAPLAVDRRYPFPRRIYSPTGGWWAGQVNWKRNTAIVGVGYTAFVFYVLWPYSAKHEWAPIPPSKPHWYMKQMKQFENADFEGMYAGSKPYEPIKGHH